MGSTVRPIEERRLLGIALILVAYICFTCLDSSAKWLGLAGIPVLQIVFLRYAGHLLITLAVFLPSRRGALLRSNNPRLAILRGLCLLGATGCNFAAIQFLPLSVIASIAFTMPLMLCALSIPMLGERIGWRRWTAILVGFAGVLIIVRPGTEAFHPASLLALVASVFTALYFLLTRKLAGVDTTATQQFYLALVPALCLAPLMALDWAWPREIADWIVFFGIGLAGAVGHQLATIAHRFAPASVLGPFAYVQIIFLTAAGWVIFGQPPDPAIYLGAPIVIGSGLYIWLRERALAREAVPRPPT